MSSQMSEKDRVLPSLWEESEIGSLCNLINGRAFKKTEWDEVGLPIIRIQNLNNSQATFNYFSGHLDVKHEVRPGTLLFAWSGTPGTSFGAHEWKGPIGALNQHIYKIEFNEEFIDKRFFKYSINQKLGELIGNAQGGVGLRHVTKSTFTKTKVSFPPLNEQFRIANKLDSLLAKVEAAQARLGKIPTLLKRFRQSVLAAATSGDLTEEWRASRETSWEAVSLGDVGEGFNYGSSAKSKVEGEVPVLRMGNLQDGKLDWDKLVYTSDEKEIEKYLLGSGDVLFNRTNSPELVGKTSIYRGERKAIYAGYLIRVRGTSRLNSEYLNIQLNSPHARDYCWSVKTDGVSQSNINAQKLKAYEFNLPPFNEQKEIVRRVESLFALADKVEKQYVIAKQSTDRLTQSLLAKAFRGELVNQDPTDEPASELLKRISLEKALIEKKPKKPKKQKKPKMKKERTPEKKDINSEVYDWVKSRGDVSFSFDDVQQSFSSNYEELKNIIFDLLADKDPFLEQVFNEEKGVVEFKSVTK